MRNLMRTFVIAALALAASRVHATAATCTVSELDVAGTFPFFNIGGVGLEIPVDIDAANGLFTLHREAFTTPYPSPGLKFDTQFNSFGWLDWDSGPVQGTIDSNGQIVLPNFGMRFWTDFTEAGVPSIAGSMNPTLSTGVQVGPVGPRPWLFFGQQLGADGVLRLVGTGFINFQIALQTGTGLTCRLAPAPNLAEMPKGPSLASVKGKVKPGPDLTIADDELTLTAVLVSGKTPPDLDGSQDVVLRLKGASGDPLNIFVPGGHLQAKGKKLVLQDADGSVIQDISDQPSGQDQSPAPPPTKGGSLVVTKTTKKRTTFVYKVKGIETAQLSGPVDATLGVGNQSATRQVTFVKGNKATKVH
jgi:hypothetical protein